MLAGSFREHEEQLADVCADHLEQNYDASVLNCGTDLSRASQVLLGSTLDALVVLSGRGDEIRARDLDTLIYRAWSASCPIVLSGVPEQQASELDGRGRGVLHVLPEDVPLHGFWQQLDRLAGVERNQTALA